MTRDRFQWVLRKVVGAVALVALVLAVIAVVAIELTSRADDIAQAPARIGGFLGWLEASPANQVWAMIGALVVVLLVSLYDGPLPPLSWFGFGGDNTRKEPPEHPTAAAADASPQRMRPDWPIRDLFFHIRPDVTMDDGDLKPWREVAREIKQAHGEGDLVIWATPMPEDHLEEMHFPDDRKPARKLRTDYFQEADFTYVFFDDSEAARFKAHCEIEPFNRKDESYCDLKVNKAQALALWPQETAKDEATGGVPVWRMSQMLAEQFGWSVKQAADAIESAASLGDIRVIGRTMGPGTPPLRVLPPETWADHQMNLRPPEKGSLGQTFAQSNRFGRSAFYDLRVFESEVKKAIKRNSGLHKDRG